MAHVASHNSFSSKHVLRQLPEGIICELQPPSAKASKTAVQRA